MGDQSAAGAPHQLPRYSPKRNLINSPNCITADPRRETGIIGEAFMTEVVESFIIS